MTQKNIPCASDALYRNKESLENRLELFHLFRLHRQADLDKAFLQQLSLKYNRTESKKDKPIILTCFFNEGEPGCEKQFLPESSSVKLEYRLKSSEFIAKKSKLIEENICADAKSKSISFYTAKFPLISQNKRAALEKICEIQHRLELSDPSSMVMVQRSKIPRTKYPFPKRWLDKDTECI